MTTGDACHSVSDFGAVFVRRYKHDELRQGEIDAIVVDFINFFATTQLLDYGMYTKDLRSGKKLANLYAEIDRKVMSEAIKLIQAQYLKESTLERIKMNSHMNELGNETVFTEEQACEVVEAFIQEYLKSKLNIPRHIVDNMMKKKQRIYDGREWTIKHLLAILIVSGIDPEISGALTPYSKKLEKVIKSTHLISLGDFRDLSDWAAEHTSYHKNSEVFYIRRNLPKRLISVCEISNENVKSNLYFQLETMQRLQQFIKEELFPISFKYQCYL